jgi:hypothetical protein
VDVAGTSQLELQANNATLSGVDMTLRDSGMVRMKGAHTLVEFDRLRLYNASSLSTDGIARVTTERLFSAPTSKIVGKGNGDKACRGVESTDIRGGSHAGVGSPTDVDHDIGKILTYGDVFSPRSLGSGGCDQALNPGISGPAGGGALYVTAHETCELHGTLIFSGEDGSSISNSNRYVQYSIRL